MGFIWRLFMILVDIIIVPLCLFLLVIGVAIWWSAITFVAKFIFSGLAILAGIVFGFITIMLTILSW